ncbi:MAG: hypothetical protein IJ558_11805 [Treponema sp.]|nr:hypothetical protein [Treponema sp.]
MKKVSITKILFTAGALAFAAFALPSCSNIGEDNTAQTSAVTKEGKVGVSVSLTNAARTIISDISGKTYTYKLTVTNSDGDTEYDDTVDTTSSAPAVYLTPGNEYKFIATAYSGEAAVLSGEETKTISADDAAVAITLRAVTGETVDVNLAVSIDGAATYGVSSLEVGVYTDSALGNTSTATGDDLSASVDTNGNYIISGTITSGVSKWLKIDVKDSDGTVIGTGRETLFAINSAPLTGTVTAAVTQYKATIEVTTSAASAPTLTLKNTTVTDAADITLSTKSTESPYTYTGYVNKASYNVLVSDTNYGTVSGVSTVEIDTNYELDSVSAILSDTAPTFYSDTITEDTIRSALTVSATSKNTSDASKTKTDTVTGYSLAYYSNEACTNSVDTLTDATAGTYYLKVTYGEKTSEEAVSLTLVGISKLTVAPTAVSIPFGTDGITLTSVTKTYTDDTTGTVDATAYQVAYYSDAACTESNTVTNIASATHGTYYAKVSYKTASALVTVTVTTAPSTLTLSKTTVIGVSALSGVTGTVTYTDNTTADIANSALSFRNTNSGDTITSESSLTAGVYTLTATYEESASADGTVIAGAVTVNVQLAVQEALPYAADVSAHALYTTAVPLTVNAENGISFSFKVTGLTSDWTHIVRTLNTALCLPNMDWWSGDDGKTLVTNFWPDVDNGATFTNDGAWNSWSAQSAVQCAVISIASDGTVTLYKNGELKITYAPMAAANDSTLSVLMPAFFTELATTGVYFEPTDGVTLTDMVIDVAKSADEVAAAYTAEAATLSISGQTTSYQQGDTFSFDGTAVVTDSYGRTYTVTGATATGGDTSSTGTKTVEVTYTADNSDVFTGSASATYEITVTKSISSIEETTVSGLSSDTIYYNFGALKNALINSPLAITATYTDNTTEAIDLTTVTFTYASNKVTVVYAGKSIELSESLTCASHEGTYSSVYAGDVISLPDGSKIVARFTLDTKGSANWNTCYPVISNVNVVPSEGTSVTTLYCRTDNWVNDIGNANIDGVYTIASDWNWDEYSTFLVGATGTVEISYSSGTISVNMTFVNGDTSHYQNYTFVNTGTDTPTVVLFADGCTATFE